MEILCVGDLHLGRRPAHASAVIDELESASDISPRAAWYRCVDYALQRGVSAVVLTGDLVEHPRDFYEAYRDLEGGIGRLRAADIGVIGIAGNHDYQVLPELARAIEGFHLLGAGGFWETYSITGPEIGVELVGWSFTGERAVSPLTDANSLPPREAMQRPRLGLLHCDRDVADSPYAPVKATTLATADVDGWLLGHIHKPDALTGPRPEGYLGSVVGLDPTEDGPHGPWLLTVGSGGELSIEQVVLAPLRWAIRHIEVSDLTEAEQVHRRIVEDLHALDAEIDAEATQRPVAVGRRLRLVGRTHLRSAIQKALERADLRASVMPLHETTHFVDDWRLDARPAIDLEAYAEGLDPAGLLARRLLLLEKPDDPECQALVHRAQQQLADVVRLNNFARLGSEPPTEQEAADYLRQAGLQALDRLIAQRETRS